MKILKYCVNTKKWIPEKLEWIMFLSSISVHERHRISSFAYKKDAKNALVGHLLIKYCVAQLLNVNWNFIVVKRTIYGKPYVDIGELISPNEESVDYHIDFNISHSGSFTIIVACLGIIEKNSTTLKSNFQIGCDVMKVQNRKSSYFSMSDELDELEYIINSQFNSEEIEYIYSKSNFKEKLIAFYRLWCLKESFIKAIGLGFEFEMKRITLLVKNDLIVDDQCFVNDTQIIIDSKILENCSFYEQFYYDTNISYDRLYIMTMCLINTEEQDENTTRFTELIPSEISDYLMYTQSIKSIDENEQYENSWISFCNKPEE